MDEGTQKRIDTLQAEVESLAADCDVLRDEVARLERELRDANESLESARSEADDIVAAAGRIQVL